MAGTIWHISGKLKSVQAGYSRQKWFSMREDLQISPVAVALVCFSLLQQDQMAVVSLATKLLFEFGIEKLLLILFCKGLKNRIKTLPSFFVTIFNYLQAHSAMNMIYPHQN